MNYSHEKSPSTQFINEDPPDELTSIFSILEELMLGGDQLFLYVICLFKCHPKILLRRKDLSVSVDYNKSGLILFNRCLVWNTSCSKHANSLGKVVPNIYLTYLLDISSC